MWAIIPAAGRGTRIRPLTLAVPKELLPAGDALVIERAVHEALEAGIRDICVILRRGKENIAEHLAARGAIAGYRLDDRWQPRPLGAGHALYCARDFATDSPFLLLPDLFPLGPVHAGRRLLERYRFGGPTILSRLVRVPGAEAPFFPGARRPGGSTRLADPAPRGTGSRARAPEGHGRSRRAM
ncbi:MAG TPA: sugar phosphate nucleotidyltransferase [Candidatus Methylomirabilis sp.]|nr:sugar phosphate nucleotidyltransferase [Candidatus Methylomirabilis sp.]